MANRRTQDDSEEKTSGYAVPIFAPVVPPMITSISHEELVKWRGLRREYEAKMRARVRISGENYDLVTLPVKESFSDKLLKAFCTFRLGIKVEDATDEILLEELNRLLGNVKNDDIPDIKALFKGQLRMNMQESDVDARILSYFERFDEIVEENGLEGCFAGPDGEKEKCRRIMASLAPPALKSEVKMLVFWKEKGAATDMKKLYDIVYEKAKEHERHFQQSKRLKREATKRGDEKSKSTSIRSSFRALPSGGRSSSNTRCVGPPAPSANAKVPLQKSERTVQKPTRKPPSPCPKCQAMHWLNDCTVATEAEKVELRLKLREDKQKRKVRLKRLGELLPPASRTVTINGVLKLPCCPDTGSTYTVMSRSQWEQLIDVDSTVEKATLDPPIEILTYGAHPVIADTKAMLHVLIHTAAGPVEPMEAVPCLIADSDDEEFIIGRDLLGELGIDVDRQLEQLASRGFDDNGGDPFELEADEPPMATDQPTTDAQLHSAVERLIEQAVECGFPVEKVNGLRHIVFLYDVWRLELRDDPPANVPPLELRLKDGAQPTKCKPRKYPPHIRKFLRDFNAQLVELGFVYENPTSRWSSPVLPVQKSGDLMDLRQTADYRVFNSLTEVMAAVMPILAVVMENARGKQHFGLFDFLKGFWQLPLAAFCQEWLSYMTDEKIFTPTRVPQGSSDAAIHFQQTMEKCFASLLYKHLLVWIDDILLFADDIDTYLEKLREFFSLLDEFGLKLSAKKCKLYQQEVTWCGKILDANGIRHDPSRIDTLRAIPVPSTAAELQQFVCAVNWMRESLVDFARQISPLQKKLDSVLTNTRRTKRAAAGIRIELDAEEIAAFEKVKEMLASSATLDFPDDSATTCLFCDASDYGWALIVTQVANYDMKVPITSQQQHLLQCLSGTFTGNQLNWTVLEKEAFPIAAACDKLDYLLLRPQGFRLYCDHRNLIHIFAPDQNVKKHVRGKLLRWSLKLLNYRYIIEHVPGPKNVWADMISRWAGRHVPASTKRIRGAVRDVAPTTESLPKPTATVALRPLDDDNFVWPTFAELASIQQEFERPERATLRDDGLITLGDQVWIPAEAENLLQRLFIVSHCGSQGHRGHAAMVEQLRRVFAIKNLSALAARFVRGCRLCMHVKGGKIIPRPWGETIDCTTRNGVLHFDFLSMGDSFGDSQYILVLKDHATHFCELVVADTADSTVAVEALLAWHSRFGLPPAWVSDQGSHFKNEVMQELSRRMRSKHQFTPAYCPWINGSVERVNRDILQVVRVLILEYKIHHRDWVYLVPMVQSSINHTPLPSLGNCAPVELFTGLSCPTPLREFYCPDNGEFQQVPPNSDIDTYLSALRSGIVEMHKAVEDQRLKQRLLNKKKERGDNLVNFSVGDFVLRSRVDEKHGNKLLVVWVGPYRVIRTDPHSFGIQHLVTGHELDVHASRLKFYADDSLDVTEELLEHISAQGIILAVEKLKEHRWNDDIADYEILVQWKGLESIEDSYELLSSLDKDVPVLVAAYVEAADPDLQKYWRNLRSTSGTATAPSKPTAPSKHKGSQRRPKSRAPAPQQRVEVQAAPATTPPARVVTTTASGQNAAAPPTNARRPGRKPRRRRTATSEAAIHVTPPTSEPAFPSRHLDAPREGAKVRAAVEPISRRTRSRTAADDLPQPVSSKRCRTPDHSM